MARARRPALSRLGPRRVAGPTEEIGRQHLRQVDVALHLGNAIGGLARLPSALQMVSPESFQPWFDSPLADLL